MDQAPVYYKSKSEWERLWFNHGKHLGRKGAPPSNSRKNKHRVECASWSKVWFPYGIKFFAHQVPFPPDITANIWERAMGLLFTQTGLDVNCSLRTYPPKNNLRPIFDLATTPQQDEISYARFMNALATIQARHLGAIFILTGVHIRRYDWSAVPRGEDDKFNHGIANMQAGVGLANIGLEEDVAVSNICHETLHLLGFYGHHHDYSVRGFGDNESCVMDPNNDHHLLCERDLLAVRSFWRGVEQRLGQRFFR
ncbi:hypothetical protein A2291_06230 [candidate division WOR-1 bacterium RIFOXYB2_FULL_42_35]|uniref:Uncharacterized protein n=1 Tax=candidate division WOR-1 bacterium RIFOXYC2_FULL_41_25 TaxID=1802586 RepID=A0A1F4TIS4_UNCSA|nr:MAG: hypothetical protein A2247_07840 [candidate division WOR-1 bacterium RIFOXYA2_FULL_41_14]OGC21619.1 MAG: hypothetical protein A2291_06230 [candidate division WOR-1 bacterium RIFOXYB2_FULL_42_35]OGC32622.1 MAG: hypothetical protein A2462_01990 [candidate division WOR-1 bacterium RIFOXYC2_FULL_41_25]OGC41495.1 MAG: hypothetical protein A2548_04265 [candidate division WOR-1 bacterium RIFOXYD2_FULL_41_8]